MKNKLLIFLSVFLFFGLIQFACSGGVKKDYKAVDIQELAKNQPEVHGTEIKEGEIDFKNPLNVDMVKNGQNIFDLKCFACHRLTSEKLVGPGWSGVTKRRTPTWIMNMITNVEMMLEKDPEAQKLLELCLVRMPNQNVTREQARDIIEFMRKNDGEK
jgi:hypothetical protein